MSLYSGASSPGFSLGPSRREVITSCYIVFKARFKDTWPFHRAQELPNRFSMR